MKYPKLWDGPTAIGEANARALDSLAMPFSQKFGLDSQSYEKNGFREVHQQLGKPYLWGPYAVNVPPPQIFTALLSPEDAIALTVRYRQNYTLGTANADANPFKVFVGDNYVLRLFSDSAHFTDDAATVFWPSIARCDALGREYLSTEAGHEHHSLSYIDTAQISGLGNFQHSFSLWATGWDTATPAKRYRFGMACRVSSGGHFLPVCFLGSTGGYVLTQVAYPFFAGRDHYRFTVFTVAPGALQALHTVVEDVDLTQIPPYLNTSTDHGATWSTSSLATLLGPYLYQHPASGPTRAYYDADQLETLCANVVLQPLSGGYTALYVANAYVDGSIELNTARFAPALFIGAEGVFTKASWPPDEWYVNADGTLRELSGTVDKVGWTFMQTLRAAQWAFGIDCLYVPVYQGGAWKIMFTRDRGASWAYSPAVPTTMISPTTSDFAGAIVLPYESAERPGRIIFSAPDYAENKLRFYATTGNFDSFKLVGTVVKAKGDLFDTGVDDTNFYFVNFGGKRYPPHVFPAFPDEYDKP